MPYFAQACCCGCETPIYSNFQNGSTPGPGWTVVSGAAPTVDNRPQLTTPDTLVICDQHFEEPQGTYLLYFSKLRGASVRDKVAARLVFDYHDSGNYQFCEMLFDTEDNGGVESCSSYDYPHRIRFGSVGSGAATILADSPYAGVAPDDGAIKLCIREEGYVIVNPATAGTSVSTLKQMVVYTEVTSPRFGFGVGSETDAGSEILFVEAHAFEENAELPRGACWHCQVDPNSFASRFSNFAHPVEVEIEIPAAATSELTFDADCACHAGTYYVSRKSLDDYESHFALSCDEHTSACGDGPPVNDLVRVSVSTGSTILLTVERQLCYPPFSHIYFWLSDVLPTNLDPNSFEIALYPMVWPLTSGCVNDQIAYMRSMP